MILYHTLLSIHTMCLIYVQNNAMCKILQPYYFTSPNLFLDLLHFVISFLVCFIPHLPWLYPRILQLPQNYLFRLRRLHGVFFNLLFWFSPSDLVWWFCYLFPFKSRTLHYRISFFLFTSSILQHTALPQFHYHLHRLRYFCSHNISSNSNQHHIF